MIVLLGLLSNFTPKKQLNIPDLESKENDRFFNLIMRTIHANRISF